MKLQHIKLATVPVLAESSEGFPEFRSWLQEALEPITKDIPFFKDISYRISVKPSQNGAHFGKVYSIEFNRFPTSAKEYNYGWKQLIYFENAMYPWCCGLRSFHGFSGLTLQQFLIGTGLAASHKKDWEQLYLEVLTAFVSRAFKHASTYRHHRFIAMLVADQGDNKCYPVIHDIFENIATMESQAIFVNSNSGNTIKSTISTFN